MGFNKTLLLCFFTFSVLISISVAQQIDKEVFEELETQDMVEVSITLQDNSGIDIKSARNPSERESLLKERDKLNMEIRNEIINSLSEDEFVSDNLGLSSRGFSGKITKKGLNKLQNDPRVLRISLPLILETQPDEITFEDDKEQQTRGYKVTPIYWLLIGLFIFLIIIYYLWKLKNAKR